MNGNGSATVGRETLIGALVLIIGAGILVLSYIGHSGKAAGGYDLTARFAKAEGISVGSEVQLAGVRVGQVIGQRLDRQFRAVLTMRIATWVQLPTDSAALIQTDGLLGAKFVALQPGAEEKNLKPGSEITLTQSSMNVTDILDLIISQAEAKRPPDAARPPSDMFQ